MKAVNKVVFGLMMGAGVLGLTIASSSAAIVCSGHECWHTHDTYEYPHEAGIVIHPDNWRWGDHEHYSWHEHEGRGYWHGGMWKPF